MVKIIDRSQIESRRSWLNSELVKIAKEIFSEYHVEENPVGIVIDTPKNNGEHNFRTDLLYFYGRNFVDLYSKELFDKAVLLAREYERLVGEEFSVIKRY